MKTVMPLFEDLAKKICGPNCIKLIKIMELKDNISEFELADRMKININEMRSMLYKLNEQNLVYSTRKKDKEKGWYIYYWSFNFKHARDLLVNQKNMEVEKLKEKLNLGSHTKYICENGCDSYNMERAMELNFRCPECNSLLKMMEVNYKPEIINKKISETEEQLDMLNRAIIVERVPVEKKTEDVEAKGKKKVPESKRSVKKKPKKKAHGKKPQSHKPKKPMNKKQPARKLRKPAKPNVKPKPNVKRKVKPKNNNPKKKSILGKLRGKIRF